MTPRAVIALAQRALKVKTENIKSASIDESMIAASTGAFVLRPDRDKIGQLVDQLLPQESTMFVQPNGL